MKSEAPPPTHGRRFWLGQLPYLALALVGGVIFASLGGFPPAWPILVFVETLVVAVFVFRLRRERQWHEDLPNRIRRNNEAG